MFPLNAYSIKLDLLDAISFAYEGGTTKTAAAINLMTDKVFTPQMGDRPDVSTHTKLSEHYNELRANVCR